MATSISQLTPYRDPRTAFARPIAVGEVIDGAPSDPAPTAQQSARAPGRFVGAARMGMLAAPIAAAAGLRAATSTPGQPAAPAGIGDIPRGNEVAPPAVRGSVLSESEVGRNIGNAVMAVPGASGIARGIGAMPRLAAGVPTAASATAARLPAAANFTRGMVQADAAMAGSATPGDQPRATTAGIAAPPQRDAGGGRGFVNPPLANPNAPRPTMAPAPAPAAIDSFGVSVVGNGDGGASLRDIYARTSATNRRVGELSRELDASGPGASGGGISGIAGSTISQDLRAKTDAGSAANLPGLSQRQRATLLQREQESGQAADVQRRGQEIGLVGQGISAQTSRDIATTNADRTIEAAGIGAGASRDVARIGADARRSVAEQAALAQAGNAEARVTAAEAKANAPKFLAINLPDTTGPTGERLSGGQVVINAQTGQRVGEPQAQKPAVTPKAEYDKMPKGDRYVGPDGKTYVKG